MPANQKKFKQPPKRFQPKGLNILYEDHYILVVDKRSGLLSISTDRIKENTAHYLLNEYVKKGNQKSKNRVYIVHRLDRDTSGVLVFAKTEKAKEFLQKEWEHFDKKYYAVVHGVLDQKEGLITSYLRENSIHRMYSVTDPDKGKLAKTEYKVIRESSKYSLLLIKLLTGRKNQIRVHFAEKGHAVAGDKSYGLKDNDTDIKRLMLHAAYMRINHPLSGEEMIFEAPVPAYFTSQVNRK